MQAGAWRYEPSQLQPPPACSQHGTHYLPEHLATRLPWVGVLAEDPCKRNRRNSFPSACAVPKRAISHAEGGSSRPPPWLAGTSRLDHVARNVAADRGQRRGGVLSGSFSKGRAHLLAKQARPALIPSFSPAGALHPKVISAPRCRQMSAPPPLHRGTHLRTAHPEPKLIS